MRHFARVVAGLGVVALSLCVMAAASAAPKATTTVNVTITDKAIKLSKKTATAGDVVTFAVKNSGKARHNFAIAGKHTPTLAHNKTAKLAVTFSKAGSFKIGRAHV